MVFPQVSRFVGGARPFDSDHGFHLMFGRNVHAKRKIPTTLHGILCPLSKYTSSSLTNGSRRIARGVKRFAHGSYIYIFKEKEKRRGKFKFKLKTILKGKRDRFSRRGVKGTVGSP